MTYTVSGGALNSTQTKPNQTKPGLAISNAKIQIHFQIKYTEAILSNSIRKLLWFEVTKMLIVVFKNKFIVLFIIIFGTLSFPINR